jgi:hypothetical protein
MYERNSDGQIAEKDWKSVARARFRDKAIGLPTLRIAN